MPLSASRLLSGAFNHCVVVVDTTSQLGPSLAHGQAVRRTTQSILLSPSIEYAGHLVYATYFELGINHWAREMFPHVGQGLRSSIINVKNVALDETLQEVLRVACRPAGSCKLLSFIRPAFHDKATRYADKVLEGKGVIFPEIGTCDAASGLRTLTPHGEPSGSPRPRRPHRSCQSG